MRILIALFLCLNIVACGQHRVENPMASAKTFASEEFQKDYYEAIYPYLLLTEREIFEMAAASSPKNPDRGIEKAIRKFAEFRKKYSGKFRLRMPNGDLQVTTLSGGGSETLNKTQKNLRLALSLSKKSEN